MKNINGITIISLVITIIVLLILAGVTIAFTLGDNGILTKTKEAQEKHINRKRTNIYFLFTMWNGFIRY